MLAGRLADDGGVVERCAVRGTGAGQRRSRPDREQYPAAGSWCAKPFKTPWAVWPDGLRDVIGVLPDAAVRVVLLDFDTLPAKPEEAEGVVRFRLKKSLPFDVEKAKVSYHAQPSPGGLRRGRGGGAGKRDRRLRSRVSRCGISARA